MLPVVDASSTAAARYPTEMIAASIAPPEGCRRDGQILYALLGEAGLYHAATVRSRMAESMPQFGALHVAPEVPQHVH